MSSTKIKPKINWMYPINIQKSIFLNKILKIKDIKHLK